MSSNRIANRLAITAGLLVMGLAPGLGRAQSSAPSTPQDQTPATQAAPAQHHHGRNHQDMAGLNLTDDQKDQMKQVHRATQAQVDAVKTDSSLSPEQKEAKIHQIRHGARKQMVKLLTPDQRQQMKTNARARRAARQQNPDQQPQPQSQPQTQQ